MARPHRRNLAAGPQYIVRLSTASRAPPARLRPSPHPTMKPSLRRVAPLAALLAPALAPAAARAQGAPAQQGPVCDVDQNKPSSLAKAYLTISRVQALPDTAARVKALREVVKGISDDANAPKQNPVGTAFTLGQTFAVMAQDLKLATSATRGDLGFTSNPTQPADLLKLVDSTMTVVEQAKPGCRPTTEQLRQMAWISSTNAALAHMNAQRFDSADAYAQRALVVYQGSPLPYYVRSVVAQNAGDMTRAATYWPSILSTTEKDTSQTARELRTNTHYLMAATAAQAAERAQGEAQKTAAREAADRLRTFLATYPAHPEAPRLQASLARMLTLTGDKAGIASTYADQLANPAKYGDLALTQAGVIASQAGNHADAAKLFAAAAEQNRFQRDALNNLAATHMQLKQYDAMVPVTRRLLEVDPANPDNYLFMAVAYQGLANASKAPAQKKALTDSLLKYNQLSEQMPTKVAFTEFTRGEQRAVVGFTLERLKQQGATAAARPRAGAPKSYTLSFEFLDKAGQVVDTQQATVGPVAAGETKAGRVESAKPDIVAYRYRIVE